MELTARVASFAAVPPSSCAGAISGHRLLCGTGAHLGLPVAEPAAQRPLRADQALLVPAAQGLARDAEQPRGLARLDQPVSVTPGSGVQECVRPVRCVRALWP